MNPNWQQLISATGSASTAPDSELSLYALDQWGLIRVSGDDAESFLQGQFTADVKKVNGGTATLGAYCTPKGRMLASFLLFRWQEAYYLWLPLDTLPVVMKKLPMFVLMSKVEITDVTDSFLAFGVAGDAARSALSRIGYTAPEQDWDVTDTERGLCLRLPGAQGRYLVVGSNTEAVEDWTGLKADAGIIDGNAWLLEDIRAGLPWVFESTSERFIPQMLNLDALGGVGFDKGCYTGQEVVARMKYLGQVKRRTYYATADTQETPRPGDELFSGSGAKSGQGPGAVVQAALNPEGRPEMLAVIERKSLEAGDLHLGEATGAKLELLQQPYNLDEQE